MLNTIRIKYDTIPAFFEDYEFYLFRNKFDKQVIQTIQLMFNYLDLLQHTRTNYINKFDISKILLIFSANTMDQFEK